MAMGSRASRTLAHMDPPKTHYNNITAKAAGPTNYKGYSSTLAIPPAQQTRNGPIYPIHLSTVAVKILNKAKIDSEI